MMRDLFIVIIFVTLGVIIFHVTHKPAIEENEDITKRITLEWKSESVVCFVKDGREVVNCMIVGEGYEL